MDSCKHANVTFKTLPSIGELIDGTLTISQIKNVEIEDLLGRDAVVLDHELIGGYLTGKRVLVTGAGGSIGSEICRQVAQFHPGGSSLSAKPRPPGLRWKQNSAWGGNLTMRRPLPENSWRGFGN